MSLPAAQHPTPVAPPTSPREPRDVDLLLQFVHERDTPCPGCGYNLRNLTQPVCPECREDLLLKVGMTKQRVLPLLFAITPCAFCFVVCCIFLIALLRFGSPGAFGGEELLLAGFFAVSAAVAVGLAIFHQRFVRASVPAQFLWIVVIWSVHVLVLLYCLFQ